MSTCFRTCLSFTLRGHRRDFRAFAQGADIGEQERFRAHKRRRDLVEEEAVLEEDVACHAEIPFEFRLGDGFAARIESVGHRERTARHFEHADSKRCVRRNPLAEKRVRFFDVAHASARHSIRVVKFHRRLRSKADEDGVNSALRSLAEVDEPSCRLTPGFADGRESDASRVQYLCNDQMTGLVESNLFQLFGGFGRIIVR